MQVPILMPDLGNEIAEAQVEEWLVAVGCEVKEGEQLLLIMTPKAAVEIDAPASGVLTEISVAVDDLAESGATLGVIDVAS
ncbi:MAG: lipoyl domain-containing protein [Granulosicoccus sp.]